MKKCATSLIFSPIKSPQMKKSEETHWRGCGETGMFIYLFLKGNLQHYQITNALCCTRPQTQSYSHKILLQYNMVLCDNLIAKELDAHK